MLDSSKLKKSNDYQGKAELDMAKDLLSKSIRYLLVNSLGFFCVLILHLSANIIS